MTPTFSSKVRRARGERLYDVPPELEVAEASLAPRIARSLSAQPGFY